MTTRKDTHERMHESKAVGRGSERGFGLVFTVVFLIIGVWPSVFGDGGFYNWALWVAFGFCAAALTFPKLLTPLNIVWFKFALLLHHIVNPITMGIIFFICVTPMALVMRLFGRKPLPLGFDKAAKSYWQEREASSTNMNNQF